MQRNNGAGGSLKNLIKIGPERFVVSFCVFFLKNWLKSRLEPVLKSTCIIPQIPIQISKNFSKNIDFNKNTVFDNNAPRFFLSILQENAFLNNKIEILVSNRSKCVFLQNRKPQAKRPAETSFILNSLFL